MGPSLGAYHAANTLFHYPHLVKRCYALSGIFDLRAFMDGLYDDNFYFQNPVDYMSNLTDPWFLEQLSTCEIRLVTGSGPWEKSGYSYAMSSVLARKNIPHHLDDWGAARRPRLAVLEGSATGVHFAMVDRSGRSNLSSRYCPSAMTCSSSIHTSQPRVSTSTWVVEAQSACV